MKLLRETIQKILLEEYACEGINLTLWRGMLELDRLGLHISSYWRPEDYDSKIAENIGLFVLDDMGKQKAVWMGEFQVTGEECLGAFQCTNADAQNLRGTGIGAILYDVACELVGKRGISADRDGVSDPAFKMWEYMSKNPQTYDIKGSYDFDGEQTPDDPSDDCDSISWEQHTNNWKDPNAHPLNWVFVKKDKTRPTIRCLAERGLIQYEE